MVIKRTIYKTMTSRDKATTGSLLRNNHPDFSNPRYNMQRETKENEKRKDVLRLLGRLHFSSHWVHCVQVLDLMKNCLQPERNRRRMQTF